MGGKAPHHLQKTFVKKKPVPPAAVLRQKSWSLCKKKIAAASAAAAAAARDAALPPACSSVLKGQLAWAEHIFWWALRQDGRQQAYASRVGHA